VTSVDSFSAHQNATAVRQTYDPATTAVLVVDMLNDFCAEGGAMVLPDADQLYVPIAHAVDLLRAAGATVVWVCDRHEPGDAEFRKRTPHCLAGTWGAEVVSELHRADGDLELPKHRYSAFFETDLDAMLRERSITTLVLCGVVTNICVRSTAHDAFFRGYEVVVIEDACAATGPREQASSLYDIATHFGVVTTSREVGTLWSVSA
jgi:ureidoacrylate peracid hydrolase